MTTSLLIGLQPSGRTRIARVQCKIIMDRARNTIQPCFVPRKSLARAVLKIDNTENLSQIETFGLWTFGLTKLLLQKLTVNKHCISGLNCSKGGSLYPVDKSLYDSFNLCEKISIFAALVTVNMHTLSTSLKRPVRNLCQRFTWTHRSISFILDSDLSIAKLSGL